jgi:phage terminase large subunit GpA-like protein
MRVAWDVGAVKRTAKTEMRRMTDRGTRRQIGHIFKGVTRAGEASRRPYEKNSNAAERVQKKKEGLKTLPYEIRARLIRN